MSIPDVVQHLGHYCQVTTQNRQLFGELIRLSGAVFGVRVSARSSTPSLQPVVAEEIERITDLRQPHL